MSIEQTLGDLTTAVRELIVETKALRELRADAIEKVTTAASSTTVKKDKAKDEAKQNISTSPEDRKDPYEGVKELIAAFITATDDATARESRKKQMRNILDHPKIKVAGVAEATKTDDIREDAIPQFKQALERLQLAVDYISGTTRPEEGKARVEKVQALLGHEKIKAADAEKPSFVDVKDHALFVSQIGKLVEKGDLTQPASGSDLDF